ncbi:hypothetical protein GGH95_005898, partial [Coemansia sp. RSA 1836]
MSEQKFNKSKNSDDDDNNGGSNDDEEDGADGAADQAFRVKFSIRERAIRDNPDESKAALSRVTTMLRAAPSVQRRNRRDVRTMYVPSALPVTEESFVQSKRAADDDDDDQPLTPLPQRLGTLSSPSSRIGDAVSEAFGGPATPLTPVPQRAESAPAAVNDPSLQNESTPPAIVPTTVGEPLESPSDDAKHAETECPSRPTDLDSMGAESSIGHTPVVAATIADAATAAVVSAQTDTSHVDGLTAESASDAKSLPKSEGSVRRRAPPPPP